MSAREYSADAVILAAEVSGLPDVDQARMDKLARYMVSGRWPHDLEAMNAWTPQQFREAVDSLPALA